MSEYLDFDCKNCGRHRVESNGICEKCNFDNIHNEFAQPILECLEHGAGTCRNENLIAKLRAEITRLKEENHALDQINRDIQTAAAHLDEVLAEIDRLNTERRWIPVGERLPETRQAVLLFLHSGWEISGHLGLDGNWYDNDDEQFINVTHWMPLPPPPDAS